MSTKLFYEIHEFQEKQQFSLILGAKYQQPLSTLRRIENLLLEGFEYRRQGTFDQRQELWTRVSIIGQKNFWFSALFSSEAPLIDRIHKLIFLGDFLSYLPEDVIGVICGFLPVVDIARIALINTNGSLIAPKLLLKRAKAMGRLVHPIPSFFGALPILIEEQGLQSYGSYGDYVGLFSFKRVLKMEETFKNFKERTLADPRLGHALLHYAAKGNVDIVRVLLECGLDPNLKNAEGKPLLHIAKRDPGLLKLLLAEKADPNLVDGQGKPPLFDYINDTLPSLEAMQALLEGGANPNILGKPPLLIFIKSPEIITLLHKQGAVIGDALHIAAQEGLRESVLALIKCGGDINTRNSLGETPLFLSQANEGFLTFMLGLNADPNIGNKDGFTLLCRDTTDARMVYILFYKGANMNHQTTNTRSTALHFAAKKNDMEKVIALLNCGADPTLKDIHGNVPVAELPEIEEALNNYRISFTAETKPLSQSNDHSPGSSETL